MNTTFHLAKLNIGRLLATNEDSREAEFINALDRVNCLGKRMPWFVWTLEGLSESGTGNMAIKLEARMDSNHAFSWKHLPEARLWQTRNCNAVAAE